jgi:endonuclease YncB( thermonuclease family)
MQILPATLIVSLAVFQSWTPTPRIVRSDPVLVRSVVDGDTIDVVSVGRVRLLGIDAPEIGRGYDTAAPFAREARDRLTSLVLHRWIRLEQEGQTLDVYSRHLAYVLTEDGVFVNAALVRDGLARVTARTPLTRLPELQHAESEAQAFRRGMWGGTPQQASTGYTRPSGATHKQPATRTNTNTTKKKKKSSK